MPLYVIQLKSKKNEVTVGTKDLLLIKKIYLKDINIFDSLENYENSLFIKVRSTGRLIKAKAKTNNEHVEVELNEDETGISPGQACVFYSKNKIGDKVLGGGWIESTENKF